MASLANSFTCQASWQGSSLKPRRSPWFFPQRFMSRTVDLIEKVKQVLRSSLDFDQLYLEDENGIYGLVVSKQFYHMPDLDRQRLIGEALRNGPTKLTKAERRRIRMIF